jgi:hypothetical protein
LCAFFSEHIFSRRSSYPFALRCHEFRRRLDAQILAVVYVEVGVCEEG